MKFINLETMVNDIKNIINVEKKVYDIKNIIRPQSASQNLSDKFDTAATPVRLHGVTYSSDGRHTRRRKSKFKRTLKNNRRNRKTRKL